jgi:hypothetical protein
MYEVNIELDNGMQFNDLLVNAAQLPNVHVLIGMDVIAQGDLAITNGNRHTTFSFQLPATRNIDFENQQMDCINDIHDAVKENDTRWILKLHDIGVHTEQIARAANKSVDEVGNIINRQRHNEKVRTV